MWKHRIAFLSLWCSTLFLYIFYVGYISWFLFCFVSSLPIFSLVFFWIGKAWLHINISVSQNQYEQGSNASLLIHTKSNSFLPVARIQGEITIHNCFLDEIQQMPYTFASSNTTQTYDMDLNMKACGKYEIELKHLRAYDFLGIFSRKLKHTCMAECYCVPKPITSDFEMPEIEGEESAYDPLKKGSDPSVTVGVHSYQPGDSLHAIHWKLSAKTDTYMVREFASFDHQKTAVCFSFYGSIDQAQTILAYVYGGSLAILNMGNTHELKQYEKGQVVFHKTISTRADVENAMHHIMDHPPFISQTMEVPSSTVERSLFVDTQGISSVKKGGM